MYITQCLFLLFLYKKNDEIPNFIHKIMKKINLILCFNNIPHQSLPFEKVNQLGPSISLCQLTELGVVICPVKCLAVTHVNVHIGTTSSGSLNANVWDEIDRCLFFSPYSIAVFFLLSSETLTDPLPWQSHTQDLIKQRLTHFFPKSLLISHTL